MNKTATPYQIIKAEAARLGLPTSYQEDLTKFDRHILRPRKEQPRAFVWAVRPHGTHLYTVASFWNLTHLDYLPRMAPSNLHIYQFSRDTLTAITHAAAIRFLTNIDAATRDAALAGIDIASLIKISERTTAAAQLRQVIAHAGSQDKKQAAAALLDYWFG